MEYTRLGNTGLTVSRTAFGALPIQRLGFQEAGALLREAYEGGVNFFDTARVYSDSEEKIARALGDARGKIIIASKAAAADEEGIKAQLRVSLESLNTDYIDLYQLHNPKTLPSDGVLALLERLKREGVIRAYGITSHSLSLAKQAAASGLFATLQYPFSCLSSQEEIALARECGERGMGFIAMKAMAGGLITRVRENFAFIRAHPNVVPIWGIQRPEELREFLRYERENPPYTPDTERALSEERQALAGSFCRSCGYCLPCPAGIPLENACRMDMLLGRAVYQRFITPEWRELMARTENCTGCGECNPRCPYGLRPQSLVRRQYEYYKGFLSRADAGNAPK
ncbi:MAG: aldo/keto reductase [Oscillospiraceae bacterium]|jgi:aryl-alcohol dehydrogenase-like predicted oxidoreductase|nr:aldo/keto reductase [Oscillospiraceae bacterium]